MKKIGNKFLEIFGLLDNEINCFIKKKKLFDKCENRRLRGFWIKMSRILKKKKNNIYNEKKILVQNLDRLLPI